MAGTETELKLSRRHQTAPPPSAPQHEKKGLGFLKRHLGQRRKSGVPPSPLNEEPTPPSTPQSKRRSLTSHTFHAALPSRPTPPAKTDSGFAHEPPTSPEGQKPSLEYPANGHLAPASPVQELTKVTSNGTMSGSIRTVVSGEEEELVDSSSAANPSRSGGVKWAPGFDDLPSRPRRASSSTTTRRTSIYLRGAEGSYVEGVDAGVGSKARRLSMHIPDDYELEVDECQLNEHFSILARSTKKDIGEGGAAVVRLMQSKTAGNGNGDKVFAVKEFREWDCKEEDFHDYVRKIKSEYAISKSCQHPNIIKTYRLCTSDNETKWYHVMEYCDLGDLNDLINKGYFSREDRNCMFKQLLRGVDYLHSRGVAHRDLKSENLLLSRNGCLKIADFGTAEVFSGKHPGLKNCRRPSIIKEEDEVRLCKPGLIGSRPYMAPEILKHEDYDPRGVDVWSCAIVYITLCVGGTPWDYASNDVKNYNIYCNTWDEWLLKYPDGLIKKGRELPLFVATPQFQRLDDIGTKRMMLGMLHPDPSKRWSARDALESQIVTDYPCCQQDGYSEDIKTRQRKALHNHVPPKQNRGSRFLKQSVDVKAG